MDGKCYKYCLVPRCSNTTKTAPEKLFFNVPRDSRRTAWCKAMKRDPKKNAPLAEKTPLWCCEDHFDIENDMENYMEYKIMGKANVSRLCLKKGILPHRFDCQRPEKMTIERGAALKRKRAAIVDEAIQSTATVCIPEPSPPPVTSDTTNDKGIQVCLKHPFRSKGIQAQPEMKSSCSSPTPHSIDTATSPMKIDAATTGHTLMMMDSDTSEEEFKPSLEDSDSDFTDEEDKTKVTMLQCFMVSIERNPKLFLGLPIESYFLIQCLEKHCSISVRNIFIALKKIRLNDSFEILACHFGMSCSNVSRIFSKSIPILASALADLIRAPPADLIRAHLPIPFRLRYHRVKYLIDCFEVGIEKPTVPAHQALTWSEYYGCNTIKYLVGSTPDGTIMFISNGFGGRITDKAIVEESGFLDKILPGSWILADRGFKNVAELLEDHGCQLVRPPSVSAGVKCKEQEVRAAKQIASLRCHIERVIGRIREFKMLLPKASLDNNHLRIIDCVATVACGIINMQHHLMRLQM